MALLAFIRPYNGWCICMEVNIKQNTRQEKMSQFKNIFVTCKKKYYLLEEYFLSDIIHLNKITVPADDLKPV